MSSSDDTSGASGPELGKQWIHGDSIDFDHHRSQYQTSRLLAAHHRNTLRIAVGMADLQMGMSVLDYGCGGQVLREYLPAGVEYTGYDLNPALTDVADPRGRRYDVIFAIQWMMYVGGHDLDELVDLMADMSDTVIGMVPARNFLKDQILDRILGLHRNRDRYNHSLPRDIELAFGRRFKQADKKNVLLLSSFWRWEVGN